jgi:hypothetical protein
MANISIDTTSAGYQNRLADIRAIKTFYGPRIAEYLKEGPERQQLWRQHDPIMWELMDLHRKIEDREDIA